jgi:CPA1 family monovalent cation:H+ antiporter
MQHSIGALGLLVITAALVAMLARRARIPYAVGLVVSGIALAATGLDAGLALSSELIYVVFLPPLVFEAALYIEWRELRRDLVVVSVFATVGVAVAATIVAAGMRALGGWPWEAAACFGVLIAATDPVSVIATFKESGVHGRMRLLVESESLFNDSTAAILFGVALSAAAGGALTASGVTISLVRSIGGGVAAGAAVAGIAYLVAGRTADHLVEVTITTIAAYGSFLLAERVHASGVLASLTAGLIIGNAGLHGPVSEAGRVAVMAFWEYAAFLANSLVFLLMGVQMAHERIGSYVVPSAIAVALLLASRAAAIYPLAALFGRSRYRLPVAHQHVLFWGGLRGALALALALSLPASLPGREAVLTVTFAVVAFSIVVQGVTMPMLLTRLGFTQAQRAATREAPNDS